MPNDYYLISETANITPDEPIRGWFKCTKPETHDLLLPSIHASRSHNVLQTGDPGDAVTYLLAACHDSTVWPSSRFCQINHQKLAMEDYETVHREAELDRPQVCHKVEASKQENIPERVLPKSPVYPKYKPHFWSQDITDPHVIDAARSLFFERKKQRAVYETGFASCNYPPIPQRMSTDYELFLAWATLSKSEKMKYISEVTGDWYAGSSQLPTNTLETERAVNILYSSCTDAVSWPSLEYLRLQQQPQFHYPPPPLRVARLHHLQHHN